MADSVKNKEAITIWFTRILPAVHGTIQGTLIRGWGEAWEGVAAIS
jgi:hypothetical protein